MISLAEFIIAIVLAAGIPSTVFSLVVGRYMRRLDARDATRAEGEALAYQADQAALGGVRECAKAITTGKHNGDLDRSAAYADDIKHRQADYMARKAAAAK